LGMLFMVFGFAVALRHGWLRHYAKTKLGLFLLSFVLIIFFQYKRYDITITIVTIVDISLALACITGFVYIFYEQLKTYFIDKKPLNLNSRNFTKRQITCIYGVLNRKTTSKIAAELDISQSAVKKELVALYGEFGVSNYMEFYLFLSDHEVFL
jgi:DNA-binding CsgD family transcriptional regulator